jgi:hypothetical protein
MARLKALPNVVVWSAVFVAVLEVSARLDDRLTFGTPLLSSPSLANLQVFDDTGIHGRPFARFQNWRLNSLGLQGVETSERKPPETLRVVVLGASESFGPYERAGMSYPAQLERLLADRLGGRVEVLNAALPGMSLPRVTEFCEKRLRVLQPDVVVYYPSPVTYLTDEPPTEVLPPPSPAGAAVEWRFLPKLLRGINQSLPGPLLAWRLDTGQRRALAALRRGRPESWLFRQVPRERLDLFESHLRKLAACLSETGARTILATHANRFGEQLTPADRVQLVAWQIFYPRADGPVLIAMDQAGNEVIRRVSRESGSVLADVAAAVPPSAAYFRDFVHFTDEGSSLVARELLEAVGAAAGGRGGSLQFLAERR